MYNVNISFLEIMRSEFDNVLEPEAYKIKTALLL